MKLTHYTDISEKRDGGRTIVNQRLLIEVSYDPKENSFVVDHVWIIEQNCIKIEVSKLLHKAEGNPLNTILESIDWQSLYADYKEEQDKTFDKLPSYDKVPTSAKAFDEILLNTFPYLKNVIR